MIWKDNHSAIVHIPIAAVSYTGEHCCLTDVLTGDGMACVTCAGGEEVDSEDLLYSTDEHKVSIYSSGQNPGILSSFSAGNVNSSSTTSSSGGEGGGGGSSAGGGGSGGKGNKPKKPKKTPIPVRLCGHLFCRVYVMSGSIGLDLS